MTRTHNKHDRSAGYASRVLPAGLSRPAGYIAKGIAAASATGLIAMAAPTTKAEAAPLILPQARDGNPLMMPVNAGMVSKPALVDIDADGDLDMFIGGEDGTINYFENVGTDSAPDFQLRIQEDSPFWYYDSACSSYFPYDLSDAATPTFVDLDGDGDLDFVGGEHIGALNYFENVGTASAPEFVERTGSDAPAPFWYACGSSYYQRDFVGEWPAPTFVDIDGDGDQDMFLGEEDRDHTIYYYENNGTAIAPNITSSPQSNPFGLYSTDYNNTPVFVDIDGDGDMDAFLGGAEGKVDFFKNVGTAQDPDFEYQGGEELFITRAIIPLETMDGGEYSAPAFGDIDGDGDWDAFVGGTGHPYRNDDSQVFFFENTGNAQNPAFTRIVGEASPTWGVDVRMDSQPVFIDVDGDGDKDAFIGAEGGIISFFENTGDAENPEFGVAADGEDNPLNGVDVDWSASPAFVDIDGDGDMDAFIGNDDGYLLFYENVGTDTAPDFVANTGDNPFAGVDVGWDSAPVFADMNDDGAMDAFVGNGDGYILYFQNAGTASAPVFATGDTNPMNGVDVGSDAIPAAADFDDDGDIDLLIGEDSGSVSYYENAGTASAPEFPERNTDYDDQNLGYLELLNESAPTFVDIDNDGDMDVFIGEGYGRVIFAENREIVVEPTEDEARPRYIGSDSDDDTCFIDSTMDQQDAAVGRAGWSPVQAVKNMVARLAARF